MSLGKKMGHWKPFADIWSWMKKARRRSENICMMSKCSWPFRRSRSLDIKIGWESGTRCVAQIPCWLQWISFWNLSGQGNAASSCSSYSTRLFVTRERNWGGRNIGAFWRQPGGKNRSVCTSWSWHCALLGSGSVSCNILQLRRQWVETLLQKIKARAGWSWSRKSFAMSFWTMRHG